jgi:hypothetical protein
MAVVQQDPEHPAAEGLGDLPLQLDLLFLDGDRLPLPFGLMVSGSPGPRESDPPGCRPTRYTTATFVA